MHVHAAPAVFSLSVRDCGIVRNARIETPNAVVDAVAGLK